MPLYVYYSNTFPFCHIETAILHLAKNENPANLISFNQPKNVSYHILILCQKIWVFKVIAKIFFIVGPSELPELLIAEL